MSDNEALMKERAELIQKMLEMQKKFIDIEHATGIDPKDYYAPEGGTYLDEYRREYNNLAMRVNKLAHQIKESGHIH
jgi:hypothetical protein